MLGRLEQLKQGWKEQEEMRKAPKKGDASKLGRKRKMKPDIDDHVVHSEDMDYSKRDWKKKKSSSMFDELSQPITDFDAGHDSHDAGAHSAKMDEPSQVIVVVDKEFGLIAP